MLLINYVLSSLYSLHIECHFKKTHVGINTKFYDSIGMVANILFTVTVNVTLHACI